MNADRTFWIGNTHVICEDYAIADAGLNLAYAIVSDGCSASSEVDFGARAIAMSAKSVLRLGGHDSTPEKFGNDVITRARRIVEVFPYLSPQCLDATLLVAWVCENNLTAYLYGDGVFVHKSKKGVNTVHIHLTSGAPDYLSYHLDPLRRESYDKMEDNKKEVWTSYNGIWDTKPFNPFIYNCPVEEGDVVAVISDGINSFRQQDNTPIDWQTLIGEFTGFKTTEGEFAARRISAFKRKCLKEGMVHTDDISVAAIVV